MVLPLFFSKRGKPQPLHQNDAYGSPTRWLHRKLCVIYLFLQWNLYILVIYQMCMCAHSDSYIVQLVRDYRSFLLLISHSSGNYIGSLNFWLVLLYSEPSTLQSEWVQVLYE
jgi:hypothetical protein